jgi:hypothetical protein
VSFRSFSRRFGAVAVLVSIVSCGVEEPAAQNYQPLEVVAPRPGIYADFTLTADLSSLTDGQKEMFGLLIDASQIMDFLFWRQTYGDD